MGSWKNTEGKFNSGHDVQDGTSPGQASNVKERRKDKQVQDMLERLCHKVWAAATTRILHLVRIPETQTAAFIPK